MLKTSQYIPTLFFYIVLVTQKLQVTFVPRSTDNGKTLNLEMCYQIMGAILNVFVFYEVAHHSCDCYTLLHIHVESRASFALTVALGLFLQELVLYAIWYEKRKLWPKHNITRINNVCMTRICIHLFTYSFCSSNYIVPGKHDSVRYIIHVENSGENAYETEVKVRYSNAANFISAESMSQVCVFYTESFIDMPCYCCFYTVLLLYCKLDWLKL